VQQSDLRYLPACRNISALELMGIHLALVISLSTFVVLVLARSGFINPGPDSNTTTSLTVWNIGSDSVISWDEIWDPDVNLSLALN
jgi:hypothetical protein